MAKGFVVAVSLMASVLASGCPGLRLGCVTDSDCGDDGWCYDSVCVERCTSDLECDEGMVCDADGRGCVAPRADAGPVPRADAGPVPRADAGAVPLPDGGLGLEVVLTASATLVDPGQALTLSWAATDPAASCALVVETPFDDAPAPVAGAPTASSASGVVVEPTQDSTFTVTCEASGALADDSVEVDVALQGALAASATELNPGEGVTLAWSTYGARSCALEGPDALSYAVPHEDVVDGELELTAPVAPGEHRLACDGTTIDSLVVDVAALAIESVLPGAFGPDPATVTLSYSYAGPSPASCTIDVDSGEVTDAEPATAGFQVALVDTATIRIECLGYRYVPLADAAVVPRLITSFLAPDVVDHAATAELSWSVDDASGTSCTLDGTAATSPASVAFTQTRSVALACSRGAFTATAERTVAVRPRAPALTASIEPIDDDGDGVADGSTLRYFVTTSPNALGCEVGDAQGSGAYPLALDFVEVTAEGDALYQTSGGGGLADTAVALFASCWSDEERALTVSSSEPVVVYFGNVTLGMDIGGASLVMGDVIDTLSGGSTDLSFLSAVREVGGRVVLANVPSEADLGPFRPVRVVGDLTLQAWTELTTLGFNHPTDDSLDTGLSNLREVYGVVEILDCDALEAIALPSLVTAAAVRSASNAVVETIDLPQLAVLTGEDESSRSSLSVGGSPELASLSFPALTATASSISIGGATGALPASLATPSLQSVGGSLSLYSSYFAALTFDSLQSVGGVLRIEGLWYVTQLDAPALLTAGGLEIEGNGTSSSALASVTLPQLTAISGHLVIADNNLSASAPGELTTLDLRSLESVGLQSSTQLFHIEDTGLEHFTSTTPEGYVPFGSLRSVGTGAPGEGLYVLDNPSLPCAEVRALYCGLSTKPSSHSWNGNSGTCATDCD